MKFDLHVHTTASDGRLSPAAVVALAQEQGIGLMAVCDHDTHLGVAPAAAAGKACGITLVAGIEFSTAYAGRELHVLGYGMDFTHPAYAALAQQVERSRTARNEAILQRLAQLQLQLPHAYTPAGVMGSYGRAHMAAGLVQLGAAVNMADAFRRYLGPGGAAYVPREQVAASHAIEVILRCGGVPVLAHPFVSGLREDTLLQALQKLRAAGLAGVEVFYPHHSARQITVAQQICHRLQLGCTYGSDFHGNEHGPSLCEGFARMAPYAPCRAFLDRLADLTEDTNG